MFIENGRFILKDPLRKNKSTKLIEGYINSNGCFLCDSYLSKENYQKVTRVIEGIKTEIYLHRYAYQTYKGEIPEGLIVRHICDNSRCLNPNHLELGTQYENMQDMVNRGRSAVGSKNVSSKLNTSQIEEIKILLTTNKYTQTQIAHMFNVSSPTITYIKQGIRSDY